MEFLWLLGGIAGAGVLVLLIAYICFRLTFYVKRPEKVEEYAIPKGKIYEPYREQMVAWMKEVRAMPHEDVQTTSFDGLTLRGKYYEFSPDAPIELMFHGYRGSADRDLCGGVQRCFKLGRSCLIVDQRTSGGSEGNVITFGINESRDCHSWLAFMAERFGPDARILLTGISMGASTVMMAAGQPLPDTVVGVLADCGFTSAKAIICKVLRQIKMPPALVYPFIKLGAKLYGRFDLEEDSALEAMTRCQVPVIFFHGEDDDFVPCDMSLENYEACPTQKRLVTVPETGHGLCILKDKPGYYQNLREFFDPLLEAKKKV